MNPEKEYILSSLKEFRASIVQDLELSRGLPSRPITNATFEKEDPTFDRFLEDIELCEDEIIEVKTNFNNRWPLFCKLIDLLHVYCLKYDVKLQAIFSEKTKLRYESHAKTVVEYMIFWEEIEAARVCGYVFLPDPSIYRSLRISRSDS